MPAASNDECEQPCPTTTRTPASTNLRAAVIARFTPQASSAAIRVSFWPSTPPFSLRSRTASSTATWLRSPDSENGPVKGLAKPIGMSLAASWGGAVASAIPKIKDRYSRMISPQARRLWRAEQEGPARPGGEAYILPALTLARGRARRCEVAHTMAGFSDNFSRFGPARRAASRTRSLKLACGPRRRVGRQPRRPDRRIAPGRCARVPGPDCRCRSRCPRARPSSGRAPGS